MPFRPDSIEELVSTAGVTYQQLARDLGVSRRTLERWRKDGANPLVEHVDRLYEAAHRYQVIVEFYTKPAFPSETESRESREGKAEKSE